MPSRARFDLVERFGVGGFVAALIAALVTFGALVSFSHLAGTGRHDSALSAFGAISVATASLDGVGLLSAIEG